MNEAAFPLLDAHLERARRLAASRDWEALATLARESEGDAHLRTPELGYLFADSFWRLGLPAETLRRVSELEPVVRRDPGDRLLLRLVNLGGMAAFEAGDALAARGRFEELLELAADRGENEFIARACNNLGVLANVRGEREVALTFYQRALPAYQLLGHRRGLAQTHYNLGVSYRELGFPNEAASHYETAMRLAEEAGSPDVLGLAECDRGLLRLQSGDARMAVALAERARARFRASGDPVRAAEAERVLGLASCALGRFVEGRALLGTALETARTHGNLLLRGEVQRDLGTILLQLGDDSGRAALQDSLSAFQAVGALAEAERVRRLLRDGV